MPESELDASHQRRRVLLIRLLVIAVFGVAFFRTAWVAEDAFITFRVIENFLDGLGLRWNPSERVQVYTHPLWMFLLIPLKYVLGDPYWAAVTLSMVMLLSLVTVIEKIFRGWTLPTMLVALSLLFSKAFVDYTSSGLENPLVHLLIAIYVWVVCGYRGHRYFVTRLYLVASLMYLTRPDVVVLLVPSLLYESWRSRGKARALIGEVATGLAPALVWTAFSVVYYGSPVPNTALAKVNTGNALAVRFDQFHAYVNYTIQNDWPTAVLMVAGLAVGLTSRQLRPLAMGLLGWAIYLAWVGTDYMAGRFLSGSVLLSVLMLGLSVIGARHLFIAVWGAALLLASPALSATLFAPQSFASYRISPAGIADERGYYYQALGVRPVIRRGSWMTHKWMLEGQALRALPGNYTRCTIGMVAFAAGPALYWVDPLALTDPFLSRLPSRAGTRVGHYERALPKGYLDSIVSGQNLLEDAALRRLYDDVALATRAPLLERNRFAALWRLNLQSTGYLPATYDRNAVALPGFPVNDRSPFSCYGLAGGMGMVFRLDGPPLIVSFVHFKDPVDTPRPADKR